MPSEVALVCFLGEFYRSMREAAPRDVGFLFSLDDCHANKG